MSWLESWNSTQGFWTAVQGIGTFVAAVAALVALIIAGRQLGELIRSNRLLASSNDAMTESNIALTRPYVVVDYEFVPHVSSHGSVYESSIFVSISNGGKTPAKNLRLTIDRPIAPKGLPSGQDDDGWAKSIRELNRIMDGETVIHSLTPSRPLSYYLDSTHNFMGHGDEPLPKWTVVASYEDMDGRAFNETYVLEVEPWRISRVIVDPLVTIGNKIDAVAREVKGKKLPQPATQATSIRGGRPVY